MTNNLKPNKPQTRVKAMLFLGEIFVNLISVQKPCENKRVVFVLQSIAANSVVRAVSF